MNANQLKLKTKDRKTEPETKKRPILQHNEIKKLHTKNGGKKYLILKDNDDLV